MNGSNIVTAEDAMDEKERKILKNL